VLEGSSWGIERIGALAVFTVGGESLMPLATFLLQLVVPRHIDWD
jgi:hypothetical protein